MVQDYFDEEAGEAGGAFNRDEDSVAADDGAVRGAGVVDIWLEYWLDPC